MSDQIKPVTLLTTLDLYSAVSQILAIVKQTREQIMSLDTDIQAATAAINSAVSAINSAVTALGGISVPAADQAALDKAVTSLQAASTALSAALPAPTS